jgi:hypothetical protein
MSSHSSRIDGGLNGEEDRENMMPRPNLSSASGLGGGRGIARRLGGRATASLLFAFLGLPAASALGKEHRVYRPDANLLESAARDFTPLGWRVEAEIAGDLNRDGRLDAVLELIEKAPAEEASEERRRMLLVLLRARDGMLKIVAKGEKLLRCAGCQGAYAEGGGPEIRIVKGVLSVRESWGSRETGETVLRFRYDPAAERMMLIGEDLEFNDRATGARSKESVDWLTGMKIVERAIYDESRDRLSQAPPRKYRVARAKKRLDEIDCRDYEKRVEKLQPR